jgi:hypothetical protein
MVLTPAPLEAVVAELATFPLEEMMASEESGREAIAVVREMFDVPSKLTPVAVTAPERPIVRGVTSALAVEALPVIVPVIGPINWVAVIVLAVKSPEPSRATIALAVLVLVAVVAELATFPEEEMVASLVSAIAAAAPI